MKQSVGRSWRLALVAVMAAALGLAACGRKGPLDPPPPSAEVPPPPANAPRQSAAAPPPAAATAQPAPKTFFLDFLLGK